MKYSTVLFDLDGTLTDPVQGICGSVRYALEKAGRTVGPIESYHKYIGPPLLRSFEVYANATPEEAQELLGYYRERFSTVGLFENEVYPGIPELLDKLRKSGVQVAIVSNKPDPTTKALAEKFFPGVPAFGQRDDLPPKPAPDLVLCALKELGCPRESAIYVGDSEVDIQTAWNCRMNYIGVSWGFRSREKLLAVAPRAIVVDRAEEILQGKNLQLVH